MWLDDAALKYTNLREAAQNFLHAAGKNFRPLARSVPRKRVA